MTKFQSLLDQFDITSTITDEDIELLKSGKILEFSINDEYDCAMAYSKEEKR